MRTAGFSALLSPGLFRIFQGHKKRKPLTYRQWMNVKTSKKNFEDDYVMTGLGPVPLKQQGVTISLDDPISAGTRRYTHDAYALGMAVSREMKDDDLYGAASKGTKALVDSVNQRIQVATFGVLNNGFSATGTLTWNAQTLFNTAHVLAKTGGTQANRPTAEVDLDLSALQTASDNIANMVGHEGFPLNLQGKLLICHTNNRWMARELTESELKPHTTNNEINALLAEGISFLATPFITDTDSWFFATPPDDHSLTHIWRMQPQWETWDDPPTGDTTYQVYMRISDGATDHFGVYGTQGI